ncbi:MAG: hypothetical protein R8L53_06515, partial [Mariprofundales bacterium]
MHRYILLFLLFLLALPLFAWQRWQPQTWLQQQIASQKLDIHISDVQTQGLGLSIAEIQTTAMPQILHEVQIQPSWSQTLLGTPTMNVQALLDGYSQSFSLASTDDWLNIHTIDANIPAMLLKAANDSLPVNLQGNIHIQGKLDWHSQQQRADNIELEAAWPQASIEWMQQSFVLGDFLMQINDADNDDNKWLWQISGGSLVHVEGTGQLQANANMPTLDWPVSGTIHLTAGKDFTMLKTLLGANQMQFSVQGLLRQP